MPYFPILIVYIRQYNHDLAQRKAEGRMKNRPHACKFTDEMKREARRYLIYMQYSPEQIAGRCRQQGREMVSYETLYKWIWYEKRHGNKELAECLRNQGRKYAKRGAANRSRGIIKDRIGIEERPQIVNEKSRFGDSNKFKIFLLAESEIHNRRSNIMKNLLKIYCCLTAFMLVSCVVNPDGIAYDGWPSDDYFGLVEIGEGADITDIFPNGISSKIQWVYRLPEKSGYFEFNLDDVIDFNTSSVPDAYADFNNVVGIIEFKKPLDSIEMFHYCSDNYGQYEYNRLYINGNLSSRFDFIGPSDPIPEDYNMLFIDIDGENTRFVLLYQFSETIRCYKSINEPRNAFVGAMKVAGKLNS